MNPINIHFCKALWDNLDKCGHEADMTELSVIFGCSWGTTSYTNGARSEIESLAGLFLSHS